MASFLQYTASGGASQAFSIPTFSSDEIKVYVDGVLKTATTHYNITSYTTNGGTVTWTSGNVPSSGTVRIVRDTGVTTARATYAAGSSIKAGDLNDNQTQALRSLEEQDDQLIQTYDVENKAVTSAKLDTNIDIAGTLDVTGAATLDSTLSVAGTTTAAAINASGAVGVDGNFDVNTNKFTVAASSGNTTVAGTLAAGATTVTGNIAVSGTVDGRDVAADGSKLDGVEVGATADQSNAEIRTAVGAASDSNILTDALKSKLDGIEVSADVTDATNVNAAGAVMNSDLDVKGEILVGDGSGDPTALSVGTNNYVLTADSSTATGVAWKAASGGGGGAAITIQDEGSSLSTAAETINFTGAGVTASGTGTTKTITISGGGGAGVTTDFQYLELKAHNNVSGAFSAGSASYELVTKGTSTAVTPTQAAALIINIAGVIQEPNTGISIGSNDGFCIDGSSIHFGANLTAHPDYILYLKGAGEVTALADNSVTGAKIALGSDASGDIMYYNGTDYVRLAKGSDGEILKLASGAPSWGAAPSGTPEGTAILSTGESGTTKFLRVDGDGTCSWQVPPDTNTQVSIDDTPVNGVTNEAISSNWAYDHNAATGNGAHVPAAGSSGQFLKHDGTWGTPPDTTTPADDSVTGAKLDISLVQGDVIYASGTDTLARLAKGSAGEVLKMNSGATAPEWGAASSGTITALNNQAANRLTTIGSTTTQLDGEASLTFEDTTSTGLISGKQITGRGFECPATVSDDWTIAAGNNAFFPGPMTVAANKTVTVPANRTLTIV